MTNITQSQLADKLPATDVFNPLLLMGERAMAGMHNNFVGMQGAPPWNAALGLQQPIFPTPTALLNPALNYYLLASLQSRLNQLCANSIPSKAPISPIFPATLPPSPHKLPSLGCTPLGYSPLKTEVASPDNLTPVASSEASSPLKGVTPLKRAASELSSPGLQSPGSSGSGGSDGSDGKKSRCGSTFQDGVTVGYTYDALFVSDGRSKRRTNPPTEKDQQRYSCNQCGKSYATSSNLSRHKQTHRDLDSQFAKKCPECGKAYVSMPALSMHILTHKLEHSCPVCNKSFSRPWLLQGHMRSHTGQKPFGCAHCGKAFADRSNLRAHMQTHSGSKKYSCEKCGKAFALKSYLNKHLEAACPSTASKLEFPEAASSVSPELPQTVLRDLKPEFDKLSS